jgi:hypothetical protein
LEGHLSGTGIGGDEKGESGGTCEAFEGNEVFFVRRVLEVPYEMDVVAGAGAGGVAEFELFEDFGKEGLGALRGIDDETTTAIPERLEDEVIGNAVAIDTQ